MALDKKITELPELVTVDDDFNFAGAKATPASTFRQPWLTIRTWIQAQIATALAAAMAYADSLLVGLWNDRGNFDASGGAYPATGGSGTAGAIRKGDIWTISVAGTLPTGQVVEIGDTVRAKITTPGNTQANWAILQNNIGYVPENATNKTNAITGNESSTTLYASIKGIVDWVKQGLTGVLPVKTTLVDADSLLMEDSADGNKTKKITRANLKADLGIGSGALVVQLPTNPAGTTSATAVMMGLNHTHTPTKSTRIRVTICGSIANNTLGAGAQVQLAFGTGSAPTNGVAATGTTFGNIIPMTNFNNAGALDPTGVGVYPFSITATVIGLSIGTAYWFDVTLNRVTGGTASIIGLTFETMDV